MGSCANSSYTQISVMTINYSGILLSPFQYYSQQLKAQQTQLSIIFQSLIKKQFPQYDKNTFDWGLGKIDQKMQTQRYAPIYNKDVGIQNGKLITSQRFSQLWDQKFQANAPLITNLQFNAKQKASAKIFDLITYHAILLYVYKSQNIEKNILNNTKPYKDFMEKFFSKSFLNQDKKIQYTISAIQKGKTDIMFLQQANQKLIKAIKSKFKQQFSIINSVKGESVIFIRRNKFKTIHDQKQILMNLGKDVLDLLDWNHDTAIAFVDNLILFSGHLSSKKQKNPQQVEKMIESLEKMKKIYPRHHLIVGCDANSFVKTIPSFLRLYPDKQNIPTTLKKRTFMQPQVKKANQIAKMCRDHLISDLQLKNKKVLGINGQNCEKIGYLPCQAHPYDHFLVSATVLLEDN